MDLICADDEVSDLSSSFTFQDDISFYDDSPTEPQPLSYVRVRQLKFPNYSINVLQNKQSHPIHSIFEVNLFWPLFCPGKTENN